MIRQLTDPNEKRRVARQILEALEDWFEVPETREQYIESAGGWPCFAAFEGDTPIGFLCLKQTGRDTVELAVMGVLRGWHRRGVGRALFDAARDYAVNAGYAFMQVKTVQMGRYPDYDRTNRFYQALGFREFEVFPLLWDEANPCQVYVMALGASPAPAGKKSMRREIGEKKRAMTEAQIESRSAALALRLFETDPWRKARSLYAYVAFNQEVRTRPIIERAWAEGKRVAVPKVTGDAMRFIWIDDLDALSPGGFGVPEPAAGGPEADDDDALVLVPGLAFDARGHRVGYGGGYYDRWLAAHPGHPTIALCYDFQRIDRIDDEAHDAPVDLVISDN